MHQFDFCCATTTNRVPPPRPRGPGPRTPLRPRAPPRPVASSPAYATLHLRGPHMRGQGSELSPPDATNERDHSLQGHIRRRSIPRRPSARGGGQAGGGPRVLARRQARPAARPRLVAARLTGLSASPPCDTSVAASPCPAATGRVDRGREGWRATGSGVEYIPTNCIA